eukprot:GFUD01001518.1.p1 GENE.GFUD01001518.1~~GFUD01001518.1.p1  ORF type:complete len:523 (+),score=123.72 GFUD01001518.1:307-1875(+)
MSDQDICFICPNPAVKKCPTCCENPFCGSHESFHKNESSGCFPFKVDCLEGVGRVIRAARDIAPGEEIFWEKEMVVGPSRSIPPVCLGCGRRVSGRVRCAGCRWPICSNNCPEIELHTALECEIIAPTGEHIPDCDDSAENSPFYQAIMPLRVLHLPQDDLDYVLQFMDHSEDRDLKDTEEQVVKRIREDWGQEQLPAELLRRVEGILDVNTVEHRVPGGPSGRSFLPLTSLASHTCTSNSLKDKTTPGWVITRAKVPIKKGEEITFHYTGGLKGRLVRRKALKDGWYFWCNCDRCNSPGELGSEMSTLRCWKGDDGRCGGNIRVVDPLDQESIYKCEACQREFIAANMKELETELTKELEQCYRNDTEALEQLLNERTDKFHPCHYLVLIIKWLLITSWGRVEGMRHGQLSEDILERKMKYAREYLDALDVVDAGISHNRGITLWELQSVNTFLCNKRFQEERLAPVKFVDGLKESLAMVREVIFSLQFNSVGSNEDLMRNAALDAEKKLVEPIKVFSSML